MLAIRCRLGSARRGLLRCAIFRGSAAAPNGAEALTEAAQAAGRALDELLGVCFYIMFSKYVFCITCYNPLGTKVGIFLTPEPYS